VLKCGREEEEDGDAHVEEVGVRKPAREREKLDVDKGRGDKVRRTFEGGHFARSWTLTRCAD